MPPRLAKFIATFFYVGDIPLAAGSIASVLAVFFHVIFTIARLFILVYSRWSRF